MCNPGRALPLSAGLDGGDGGAVDALPPLSESCPLFCSAMGGLVLTQSLIKSRWTAMSAVCRVVNDVTSYSYQ